jgi:hypothetical protein
VIGSWIYRVMVGKDLTAIDTYIAPEYHQHDPSIPDGAAGLKAGLAAYFAQLPQVTVTQKRVIAEGDLVTATSSRSRANVATPPSASSGSETERSSSTGEPRRRCRRPPPTTTRCSDSRPKPGADFVVAGHKDPERPDGPADIGRTRRYLDDTDRLLRGSPTPLEFFEGMLSLHPERINPGILWFSALTLSAGDAPL